MSSAKIAISLDPKALKQVGRVRLARECAKLDPAAEQTAAEELFRAEAEWSEY